MVEVQTKFRFMYLNPYRISREGPRVGKCDEYQIIKLMMIM